MDTFFKQLYHCFYKLFDHLLNINKNGSAAALIAC